MQCQVLFEYYISQLTILKVVNYDMLVRLMSDLRMTQRLIL